MEFPELPVPVRQHPRWRVGFRPLEYKGARVSSLAELIKIVEQAKVRLRGWDYPHLSRKSPQRPVGSDWIGSWANNWGHIEYWRLYQSGQFLHLFAVREAVEHPWEEKLRDAMRWHVGGSSDLADAPGFFSLENFIYTITEIFEFAARLAEKGLYEEGVKISIHLQDAQGFALTPGIERAWSEFRALGDVDVGNQWTWTSAELLASSSIHALDAIVWFFERFGWFEPNLDVIKKDQEKFLKGLL